MPKNAQNLHQPTNSHLHPGLDAESLPLTSPPCTQPNYLLLYICVCCSCFAFCFKGSQDSTCGLFLFPARLTAVSGESAKDARAPKKISGKRVHQIAFIN